MPIIGDAIVQVFGQKTLVSVIRLASHSSMSDVLIILWFHDCSMYDSSTGPNLRIRCSRKFPRDLSLADWFSPDFYRQVFIIQLFVSRPYISRPFLDWAARASIFPGCVFLGRTCAQRLNSSWNLPRHNLTERISALFLFHFVFYLFSFFLEFLAFAVRYLIWILKHVGKKCYYVAVSKITCN